MKKLNKKIVKFISDILVGLETKKIDANLISSHLVKSDMYIILMELEELFNISTQ